MRAKRRATSSTWARASRLERKEPTCTDQLRASRWGLATSAGVAERIVVGAVMYPGRYPVSGARPTRAGVAAAIIIVGATVIAAGRAVLLVRTTSMGSDASPCATCGLIEAIMVGEVGSNRL